MKRPTEITVALACLALLAPPALSHAGGDPVLTWSDGTLGGSVVYALEGDPGEIWLLLPSFQPGPTILPNDGRPLSVGLDLLYLLTAGFLDPGTGLATQTFALPADMALQGAVLFTQFVTFPGTTTLVDDISNPVAFALGFPDSVANTVGPSQTARVGHTAAALADGTVLVAGGEEPDMAGVLTALDSLELFDPNTQTFSTLPVTLQHARSTHTSTVLADGRVLLLGGFDATGAVRNTGDIFDPGTGSVTPIAPMTDARTQHTATLMGDGRVLVVGGSSFFDLADVLGSLAQAKKTTEIYTPGTNSWASGPDLPLGMDDGVVGQAASLLGDGDVLITGGVRVRIFFGIPLPSFADAAWRFDPGTDTYLASTAGMAFERVFHSQITLPDGRVLVAGGADGDFILLSFFTLSNTAIYDPATNAWTNAAPLGHGRANATLLDTGSELLLVAGLNTVDVSTGSGAPELVIERAPHSVASWTDAAALQLPREVARPALVDGGARVVIVGEGDNGVPAVDHTAEIYVR